MADTARAPACSRAIAAGGQRRAGRDDVVDEEDPAPGDGPRGADRGAHAERARDVRRPLVAPELELGDRGAAALERRDHGRPSVPGGHARR